MSSGQHKAALVSSKEAKYNEVKSRTTPSLAADDVLIQITAAAVNPVDWKMRDWGIFVQEYPVILGSDAAGTIAKVGKDVSQFKIGDRVFFQGVVGSADGATFQQFAKISAELVAHTPDNISDEQAAGISLASIAAVVGLYDKTGFGITPPWQGDAGKEAGKGKSIVILGGSSSVGQYAIQLARLSGFETIVTGSSKQHSQHIKQLGATHTLDRKEAKPEDYAKAATQDGHAFAMVFDAIASNETHMEGLKILQAGNAAQHGSPAHAANVPCSTLVTVYTVEDNVKQAAAAGAETHGSIDLKTIWGIGSLPELRPLASGFMRAIGGSQGWLANGQFVPNRTSIVSGGLAQLDKALDRNRDGTSGEKVIIQLNE